MMKQAALDPSAWGAWAVQVGWSCSHGSCTINGHGKLWLSVKAWGETWLVP